MIEAAAREFFPGCSIFSIPIADGGEGTVDCFLHTLKGEKRFVTVKGPFGEEVESFYGMIGETAVIEMAAAAGLTLAAKRMDPLKASTYGVGQLIRNAVKSGCKDIILGLGGSCTNDGGAGMAAALGTEFTDKNGRKFIPAGGTLGEVVHIDNHRTEELLRNIKIRAMCDISNPMFGKKGAACVFGPQKGAGKQEVALLDENLRKFAAVLEATMGEDVSHLPGSGAAGAMGAGVCAFLGGELTSGIELLLETVKFDQMLADCDLVVTGEGRLDMQSFGGKVIAGVAGHAKKYHVPVAVLAGTAEGRLGIQLELHGIYKVVSVYEEPVSLEEILPRCRSDLKQAARRMFAGTPIF